MLQRASERYRGDGHPDGTRAAAEFVVNGTYLATDEGLPEARGQTYVLPAGGFFGYGTGGSRGW
jgi:hypothetical protein